MEPENPTPAPEVKQNEWSIAQAGEPAIAPISSGPAPAPPASGGLRWVFMGPQGLRAGWSVAIFFGMLISLALLINWIVKLTHLVPQPPGGTTELTPVSGMIGEGSSVLLLLLVTWIMSKIERRRVMDYNLTGPNRVERFFVGAGVGFASLGVLVLALTWGGWLHFNGMALSGAEIAKYAVEWAIMFLLVGCMEEGLARCYLLYTLTRGLNYWWALGLTAALCLLFTVNPKASGLWGMYAIALLGLVPCLLLQLKKAPSTGFWCAAWVTSVFFGGGHTSNPGENWIGIFSAAGIGFVFCASVRLTGSAWWAIGCHAAWDWGQSYFYGTPDSGLLAKGHLLNSTSPANLDFWTGGKDGPEGSILVIPTMVLILLVLYLLYGRRGAAGSPAAELPAS